MQRRRGVHGEEVGVKKFNMPFKKKKSVSVWEHAPAAACQGERQAGPLGTVPEEGGCAPPASGSCALSTALPALVGLFFFKEDKTSRWCHLTMAHTLLSPKSWVVISSNLVSLVDMVTEARGQGAGLEGWRKEPLLYPHPNLRSCPAPTCRQVLAGSASASSTATPGGPTHRLSTHAVLSKTLPLLASPRHPSLTSQCFPTQAKETKLRAIISPQGWNSDGFYAHASGFKTHSTPFFKRSLDQNCNGRRVATRPYVLPLP